MRILLLVHSFNSLSQRLYVELQQDGHELSVEIDIHEQVTRQAVDLFRPDLILAPFLKRSIPPSIWRHRPCLIVPGRARLGDPARSMSVGCYCTPGDFGTRCRTNLGARLVSNACRT